MISKSLEEYVKTMYVLQKQKDEIRVTDIAEKMKCSKPSVTKAINNLKDNNLIKYEAYGKIELTEEAEKIAKKVLEAYDIVYVFLKEVLELDEDDAKEEAEKVKLAVSDEVLNKLARYVHKVLDLTSLDCGYDINSERCRNCARTTFKGHASKK